MKDPVAVELLELVAVEHFAEFLAEHFVEQLAPVVHLHVFLIKFQNRHFLQELDLQTYHLGIY